MEKNTMDMENMLCTPDTNTLLECKSTQNAYIINDEKNRPVVEDIFKSFKKCGTLGCSLNSPLPHAISLYSNILFCISQQHPDRPSLIYSGSFKTICNFEKMILFTIQLDRNFKPTYTGHTDIHCEQEIESLTYKVYMDRHCKEKIRTSISDCYHVLEMLLCRKEYQRFFSIYDQLDQKDLGIYKLALLASLYTQNEKTLKILTQLRDTLGLRNSDVDIEATFPECDKRFRNLVEEASDGCDMPSCTKEEKIALFHTVKQWHCNKHKEFYWNLSLHKWSTSKGVEGATEAMLDKCIRLKKYEEGWFIYKEATLYPLIPLRMFRISRRVLSLIIHAINNCNAAMWVERYLEIASVISRLNIDYLQKVKHTFSALLNLKSYSQISCIARLILKQYPESMLNSNSVLCSIFEDIFEIFKVHKKALITSANDSSLPELAQCAYSLYQQWRKKNARGVFFSLFWGRSKESVEVYNAMLQIAIIIHNKPQVVIICKDIWHDSIPVLKSLSNTLMHVHNIYTNCSCDDEETNVLSRSYLMHILYLLLPTQ
ncbi:hypothetical protein NEIRO03_1047 [Nematocida sp. AWRm78]|nr:hypothetical protein NEIRO03_1047 [Nematocida sp. AWRm78]